MEEIKEETEKERCKYMVIYKGGMVKNCVKEAAIEGYCLKHHRKIEKEKKELKKVIQSKRRHDKKDLAWKEEKKRQSLYFWVLKNRTIRNDKWNFENIRFWEWIYQTAVERKIEVIQKASQVYATEYVINKIIKTIKDSDRNGIYILPDQSECRIFSDGRISPVIRDIYGEVARFQKSEIDNKMMKQIGGGFLYLRGTWERTGTGAKDKLTRMISSDINVYDELDACDQEKIGLFKSRLLASKDPMEIYLSSPTIEDYGIDLKFKQSSQTFYFYKCGCGFWNNVNRGYFDGMWIEEEQRWACSQCGKEVDKNGEFEWVESFPDREIKGIHINHCLFLDGKKFYKWLHDDTIFKSNREKFLYNNILGFAWSSGKKINMESIIEGCRDGRIKRQINAEGKTFLGIDIGYNFHVVILKRFSSGELATIYWDDIPKDEIERELDRLLFQFGIQTGVIDALPEELLVRRLVEKYRQGLLWRCFYDLDSKEKDIIQFKKESRQVHVNRTETLDFSFDKLKRKEILFPLYGEIEEIKNHWKAMNRVEEILRNGNKKIEWVTPRNNKDHFAHALNYAVIASEYKGNFGEIEIADEDKITDIKEEEINIEALIKEGVVI